MLPAVLFLFNMPAAYCGQTGKIVGRVIDASNKNPLPYVNVVISGTTMGAATNIKGEFIILNVPPGTYSVFASMMGYQKVTITNIKVLVDHTTRIQFKLNSLALELGKSVVITAEAPLIQKDLTATASSVSASEIENMPVESFRDVLQSQAGIVKDSQGGLHIRGGRSSEIAYMVDGVSISDPFSGDVSVEVNQNAIQELRVISGTFNAEYGQVMSGVVEVVTKDPSQKLKMGGTFYFGDYISSDRQLYYHINDISPSSIYNAQFYATGPVPFLKNKLGYYFSLRRFYNDGWIYGQRRFNPSDSSNFQSANKPYMEETGDNRAVSMNDQNKYFGNIKLVLRISPSIKLTYNFLGSFDNYRTYNHLFRFNPDGDVTNHKSGFVNILNWNHMISSKTFYTLKFSYSSMTFKSYLYKNPDDPRYVNPELLRNREDSFSFLTGGTNMTNFVRSSDVNSIKFDITSQATKIHQIKSGFEYKYNTLYLNSRIAGYRGKIGGGLFSADAFFNSGEYENHPVVFSYYAQDKIELPSMTLNIGMRYDYFNSNGLIPVDLRDPDNSYNSRKHAFLKTKPKKQVSPRIGIAFPISVTGVIHTSYGHFFQIPPYEYLYVNPKFAVAPGGLNTLMGNADLNSQSTVIYEVGYQQALLEDFGIDVTGFYKDARNLLGTRIYETYVLGDRYARYINRDYGNIRGVTLSIKKRPTKADHIAFSFDYTYQVAEGNASDPNHQFYNQQADPPKKSNIQVVPLNWDQRHTVNLSISYYDPGTIGVSLIGRFHSGLPYTPNIQSEETTFENSGRKPFNYTVDLRLFKNIRIFNIRYRLFVNIYNLFDRRNEIMVYQDTGRAGYSLISHYVPERRADVNTLSEWLRRPDFYSEPRKILIGLDVGL
ncbi:colicin I receptor precursor [bacterium BMS3Bbin03]|nr:colicin I receptor precursor [bacterium BMS3Bbin03]